MGFSSIVMYSALFIIGLFVFVGISTMYTSQIENSANINKDDSFRDGLEIINVSYADNLTTAWVKNSGQSIIPLEKVDFFVAGKFIPRNDSNRTITLYDYKNPGLFDPAENIRVTIDGHVKTGVQDFKTYYGKTSDNQTMIVGVQENETLANIGGSWSPVLGGTILSAGELMAINNLAGTNITLNASSNRSVGLLVDTTSFTPLEIQSVTIIVDYKAVKINDNQFIVEARDSTYDGNLYCSDSFGNSSRRAIVDCSTLTPTELQNIYIVLNNTADANQDIILDYIRTNVTYLRE